MANEDVPPWESRAKTAQSTEATQPDDIPPWERKAEQPVEPQKPAVSVPAAEPTPVSPLASPVMTGLKKLGKGVGESALQMATGAAGQVAGGLYGLGSALAGTGREESADRVRRLEEALTYQPRTTEGQYAVEKMGIPFEIAAKGVGKVGATIGGLLAGEQGRVAGESIGEVLPQVAMTALPLKGLGKAAKPATLTAEQEAAQEAMKAGYKLTPTQINPGSITAHVVEGLSGSAKTAKLAAEKNQPVTNSLVMQDLQDDLAKISKKKIGEKDRIDETDLKEMRAEAGKVYEQLKGFKTPIKMDPQFRAAVRDLESDWAQAAKEFPRTAKNEKIKDLMKDLVATREKSTAGIVEMTKKLRGDAASNLKSFDDPGKRALGAAQRKAASALEELVERNLTQTSGLSGWVKPWRDARQLIAKTYDVEGAYNPATGNVDALKLGKMLDKGKPLSGRMKQVAEFSKQFEPTMKLPEKLRDRAQFGMGDVFTAMATEIPMAAVEPSRLGTVARTAAGLAARPLARQLSLSRLGQRYFTPGASSLEPVGRAAAPLGAESEFQQE